jgi:uncharacterized protein (DUF983 family)
VSAPDGPPGPGGEPPLSNALWRTFVARAWGGRCPRCGGGRLFARPFRLEDACGACGLVYRREQGAMTGQMYLSAAVTEVLAGALVLVVFFATDWSAATALWVSVPLVLAFSYWFLPKAMALWVAVEFMTDLANRDPWAGM